MPIPDKRRFTDEQKQDAIQDYRFPRRSKSTAEYNHDRFLERRKQVKFIMTHIPTKQPSKIFH